VLENSSSGPEEEEEEEEVYRRGGNKVQSRYIRGSGCAWVVRTLAQKGALECVYTTTDSIQKLLCLLVSMKVAKLFLEFEKIFCLSNFLHQFSGLEN